MLKKLGIGFLAILAIGGIGNALGGKTATDATQNQPQVATDAGPSNETDSAPVETNGTEPTTEGAAPDPAPSPTEVAPELTVSQQNAIEMAYDYLDYSAFSAKGLIGQLKYEGFSQADASFAVEYIEVDWFEQAARSAQEYLDYSSFSRAGLIDQLIYEGFTREQAIYAVDQVGL